MTYNSQIPRTQAYLAGVIHWQEMEIDKAQKVRQFVKWFFDLVKNAFVVGGLKYIATKSDSLPFKIFAAGAFAFLGLYCVSYIRTWHLRFLHPWGPARWARIGDMLISLAIVGPLFVIIVISLPLAIVEIANTQMK
jgi:hypothetical protein